MKSFDEDEFQEWFWDNFDLEDCLRAAAIDDLAILIREYDESKTNKSLEEYLMEDFMESKHPTVRVDEEDEYAHVWNF